MGITPLRRRSSSVSALRTLKHRPLTFPRHGGGLRCAMGHPGIRLQLALLSINGATIACRVALCPHLTPHDEHALSPRSIRRYRRHSQRRGAGLERWGGVQQNAPRHVNVPATLLRGGARVLSVAQSLFAEVLERWPACVSQVAAPRVEKCLTINHTFEAPAMAVGVVEC